jgi:hypothetical protein
MPTSHLLAPHDDGTWRLAPLLKQYRGPDGWRCVVTYSTAPGMTYLRAYPAGALRPADEQHDQADDRGAGDQPHQAQPPPGETAWILHSP